MNRFFSSSTSATPVPAPTTSSNDGGSSVIGFKYDHNQVFPMLLNSSNVMLEARVFNETPLSTKKCAVALIKLYYLCYHTPSGVTGNNAAPTLGTQEATSIFFSVSKVFQSKDQYLRRLAYLAIKELSKLDINALIVISSLTQDVASRADPVYRANALRTLCAVVKDGGLLASTMERFIKQSLVDASSLVQSGAAENGSDVKDTVKRWISAAGSQESVLGMQGTLARYHGLGMALALRQGDRMSLIKVLQRWLEELQISGSTMLNKPSGVLSAILMLQQGALIHGGNLEWPWKLLLASGGNASGSTVSSREALALEAAKCLLNDTTGSELLNGDRMLALSVLQSYLNSSKPLLRLASLRVLHKLAQTRPEWVGSTCNLDMESMMSTDGHPMIATLAMTTLLKSGNEASVDRLLVAMQSGALGKKSIGVISGGAGSEDASELLRLSMVEAIGQLCGKFPHKSQPLMAFLGERLRDEGSLPYKRAILQCLLNNGGSANGLISPAIFHLLIEFLEDCEYAELAIKLCYTLPRLTEHLRSDVDVIVLKGDSRNSTYGDSSSLPLMMIRVLYNRLILEGAGVKMAALGGLIYLGETYLLHSGTIVALIKQQQLEMDQDLFERAQLFLQAASLVHHENEASSSRLRRLKEMENVLISLEDLEEQLEAYLAHSREKILDATVPDVDFELHLDTLPRMSVMDYLNRQHAKRTNIPSVLSSICSPAVVSVVEYLRSAFPELSSSLILTTSEHLLKTTQWLPLADPETEYLVHCRKHLLTNFVIVQYHIQNTLPPQHIFTNITVSIIGDSVLGMPLWTSQLASLKGSGRQLTLVDSCEFQYEESVFLVFHSNASGPTQGTIGSAISFALCTHGNDDEGTVEEYPLAPISIGLQDFIVPFYNGQSVTGILGSLVSGGSVDTISADQMAAWWVQVSNVQQTKQVFHLPAQITTLPNALSYLLERMTGSDSLLFPSLRQIERDESKSTLTAYLIATLLSSTPSSSLAMRLRLAKPTPQQPVAVEWIIASCDEQAIQQVLRAV